MDKSKIIFKDYGTNCGPIEGMDDQLLPQPMTEKTARNSVTGDKIQTKPTTDAYRSSPYWETRKPEIEFMVDVKSSNLAVFSNLGNNRIYFIKD